MLLSIENLQQVSIKKSKCRPDLSFSIFNGIHLNKKVSKVSFFSEQNGSAHRSHD